MSEKNRAYYMLNRERILAQKREYHAANQDTINAKTRAWYAANRDRAKQQQAGYRAAHRDQISERMRLHRILHQEVYRARDRAKRKHATDAARAYHRDWRERNRERVVGTRKSYAPIARVKFREYQQKHPEVFREAYARRRALQLSQLHPDCDNSLVKAMYAEARRLTASTGIQQSIDHIIALKSGGWHHHENLQIMPLRMNMSKNARLLWISPDPGYKDWRDVPRALWPESAVGLFESKLKELNHEAAANH